VEAVCSRVLIINKGRIVGQGRPAELRAEVESKTSTITAEVRDPEGRAGEALAAVEGVRSVGDPQKTEDELVVFAIEAEPGPDVRERIFDAAVAGGFKLLGLTSKAISLEDIFVEITTHEDDEPEPDDDAEEVSR
jgi:ABC-2 type transport system ATP-binding protein